MTAWPQYTDIGGHVYQANNRAEQIQVNLANTLSHVQWFNTQAEAVSYYGSHGGEAKAEQSVASTVTKPFSSTLDFLNTLGQRNTWIRVAKVIVGGVMLIVGLVHITGAGGQLASAARKVPLPV